MKRIMSDRGMGKTTSLMFYVNQLAKQNSDKTIYFVCHNPTELSRRNNAPENLKFITFRQFLEEYQSYRNYKVIVDEIEEMLKILNIDAYTLTLSETCW